jgi:hypothetical protein
MPLPALASINKFTLQQEVFFLLAQFSAAQYPPFFHPTLETFYGLNPPNNRATPWYIYKAVHIRGTKLVKNALTGTHTGQSSLKYSDYFGNWYTYGAHWYTYGT